MLASAASQYYLQQLYFAIKMNKKNKGEKKERVIKEKKKKKGKTEYHTTKYKNSYKIPAVKIHSAAILTLKDNEYSLTN